MKVRLIKIINVGYENEPILLAPGTIGELIKVEKQGCAVVIGDLGIRYLEPNEFEQVK